MSSLKLVYWNAQSIKNKLFETMDFIDSIKTDIFVVTESWLKAKDKFFHLNYLVYRKDREGATGGGVAICLRKNIKHSVVPDIKTQIIETISIKIEGCGVIVTAVYFPGTRLNADKFKMFENDIKLLTSRNNYIICGDLNARHAYWNCARSNKTGKILFDMMSRRNFLIYSPDEPTFYPSKGRNSVLDILLTDGKVSISEPHILHALSSPHLPVSVSINEVQIEQTPKIETFCFKKTNWVTFRQVQTEALEKVNVPNLEDIEGKNQIDDLIFDLNNAIWEGIEISTPKLTKQDACSPLLDEKTLGIIRRKNDVRRQWQRSKDPSLKTQVNRLGKQIKERIFKLRNIKWNRTLSSLKQSSEVWKFHKLFKKGNKNKIPPLAAENGQLIYADISKAELIANNFQLAHAISKDMGNPLNDAIVANATKNIPSTFEVPKDAYCKIKEIKKLVKKLKNRKAPGVDQLPAVAFKNLPKKAFPIIQLIFNACLKVAYFPVAWKYALVIPILKRGKNPNCVKSYRPISLLPVLSKLFEKIIKVRIDRFLQSTNLIPKEQFGFRNGHSTVHQLYRVSRDITQALSSKNSVGMITLDIEKAFDAVWHDGLIFKLFTFGFPLYLVKLIRSFLTNRYFSVKVNLTISSRRIIPAGVPQGSPLSPTLFNIYTSDIPVDNTCQLAIFADDTGLYVASVDPSFIIMTLERKLETLYQYYHRWRIKVNMNKTNAIFFTRKRKRSSLPSRDINFLGSSISWGDSIKYLGMTLDRKMTFKPHTEDVCMKVSKCIHALYPLINRKSQLSQFNKLLIFKVAMQPILLYAAPVWNHCAKCHKSKLQISQNKALKLVLDKPWYFSTQRLHQIANINRISQLAEKRTRAFLRRCKSVKNPLIASFSNYC